MLLAMAVAGCPGGGPTLPEVTGGGSTSPTEDSSTGGMMDPTTSGVGTTDGPDDTTGEPPAECGNGVVEGDEECDDGGESAACNADCTTSTCGDGIFNASSGEQCDDGGRSEACNDDCTNATCGDGIVNAAAGEDCDEGGETAACNSDCTAASCGDGITNAMAGEECDDGGESMTCDSDCTPPMCGDGVPNMLAGEECDDGGESAGCDADCTAAVCGDGVINMLAGETCDDGGFGACTPSCLPCGDILVEDFSDNMAGWTLDMEWGIGPAMVSMGHTGSCGNADPGTDHTPTPDNGVAGVVIGGNASTMVHDFYYLTSPVLNTAGYATLELALWRWLNSDYTPFMQNRIQVYDGAAWQTVWESGGSPGIQDAVWTNVVYDISAYANPDLQVRIGFNIADGGVYTCSQWNVDDLVVRTNDC